MRRVPWILFCLPTLGFTDCESFGPVTVPATDTDAPFGVFRVYLDDTEQVVGSTTLEVDYDSSFIVVPAIMDGGGAKELHVTETVVVKCQWWWYPEITFDLAPYSNSFVESQAGGVGSTVSNGIYGVGTVYDFTSFYDDCTPYESSVAEISYFVSLLDSVDFHGNQAYANGFGPALQLHFAY
jgi:hypothetical protein